MSTTWTTAPDFASAERLSYPGAATSGRSHTSPEGPRDENAERAATLSRDSPAHVLSPGTDEPVIFQPAQVLPDSVSSLHTSFVLAAAETLNACAAAPGASRRLPMYGPLLPAEA